MKEELFYAVEKISPKTGDILVVRVSKNITQQELNALNSAVTAVRNHLFEKGIFVEGVIFVSGKTSLRMLDEKAMNRLGWFRREKTVAGGGNIKSDEEEKQE